MKIEQFYTVLHSNIVTRALVQGCQNVLTTYHLILKNGQLVALIIPKLVPFQIISNVIICCYWYERHGAVKGCVYILMFWCFQFVCLHFNFQIKRLHANILRGCSKTSFIIKKNIRASKKIQGYYELYKFIQFSHYTQNLPMVFVEGYRNLLIIPISKELEEHIVLVIPGIFDIAVYVICPQSSILICFCWI